MRRLWHARRVTETERAEKARPPKRSFRFVFTVGGVLGAVLLVVVEAVRGVPGGLGCSWALRVSSEEGV